MTVSKQEIIDVLKEIFGNDAPKPETDFLPLPTEESSGYPKMVYINPTKAPDGFVWYFRDNGESQGISSDQMLVGRILGAEIYDPKVTDPESIRQPKLEIYFEGATGQLYQLESGLPYPAPGQADRAYSVYTRGFIAQLRTLKEQGLLNKQIGVGVTLSPEKNKLSGRHTLFCQLYTFENGVAKRVYPKKEDWSTIDWQTLTDKAISVINEVCGGYNRPSGKPDDNPVTNGFDQPVTEPVTEKLPEPQKPLEREKEMNQLMETFGVKATVVKKFLKTLKSFDGNVNNLPDNDYAMVIEFIQSHTKETAIDESLVATI